MPKNKVPACIQTIFIDRK